MGVIVRPTSEGVAYYDSETKKPITQDEVNSRIELFKQENSRGLFDKIGDAISGAGEAIRDSVQPIIQKSRENGGNQHLNSLWNANVTLETNADKAARISEATKILGLDDEQRQTVINTGMSNEKIAGMALREARRKQLEPEDWEQFQAENPATASYLSKQENMSVSWDDVKQLKGVEYNLNQVKKQLELHELEQNLSNQINQFRYDGSGGALMTADQRVDLENQLRRIDELSQEVNGFSVGGVLGGLATFPLDAMSKLSIESIVGSAIMGGIAGAALPGVGTGAGIVAGALRGIGTGLTVGTAATMGERADNIAYMRNLLKQDRNGQQMGTFYAGLGAHAEGAATAALGMIGLGRIGARFPSADKLVNKFIKTTSPSILADPVMRETAFRSFLGTVGGIAKTTAEQDIIFGGGMGAIQYGADKFANAMSGLDFGAENEFSFGGLAGSAKEGMINFLPMAATMGTLSTVGGRYMNNKVAPPQTPLASGFSKAMDAMNESKTAKRSPEAMKEFLDENLKGMVAEDMNVSSKGFMQFWRDNDPDNPNRAYEEAQKFGISPEKLDEMVALDDDMPIKSKDFMIAYQDMKTNLRNAFLQEVRDPTLNGQTPREFAEMQEQILSTMKEVQAEAEKVANDEGFDTKSETYQEALRIAKDFEPMAKDRKAEDSARFVTAMLETAEKRGLLQAVGINSAADALRMVKAQYQNISPTRRDEGSLAKMFINPAKNINEFVSNVLTAYDKAKAENKQYKQSRFFVQLAEHKLELYSDDIVHVQRGEHDHPLSTDEWNTLISRLDSVDEAYVTHNQKIPRGKNAVIVKFKDGGKTYGAVIEVGDSDTIFLKTAAAGEEKYVDHMLKIKEAGVRLLSGLPSHTAEAGDSNATLPSHSSISMIQQELKRVNTEESIQKSVESITQGALAKWAPDAKFVDENRLVPIHLGKAIITGFKGSNYASLSHEMVHHWTWLMENAVERGNAPEGIAKDLQILREFAGAEEGKTLNEAQYEKIADAFETYALEGKAPSIRLLDVFKKVMNWMKQLYRKFNMEGVEINNDVRGVFDRMLAADDELARAENFYTYKNMFTTKEVTGTSDLRKFAAIMDKAHDAAEKQMNKRVMAEVNPAMKQVRDDVEANFREDIAGQMILEPNYAARAVLSAPLDSPDFKAARESAIKAKMEEYLDLLVKQSALGVEKRGEVVSEHGTAKENWFVGDSNNYDWYKEMLNRRGGKIPASWYRFIKAYKAGEKTLKQMPKTMREEYERIAEEHLTKGHKESALGDIPEDIEFVNLKEGTPAMSWIVANGGGIRLDRASIYERYGKGALPEKWLTDKNGFTLDDLAAYFYEGKGNGDQLFQELTTKPTFAKELANRVRAKMAQFKEQEYGSLRDDAIRAVHNDYSLEAVAVELELIRSRMEGEYAKDQQKTADAIADGRIKAKGERKVEEEKQKGQERLEAQKAKDAEKLDNAVESAKEKATTKAAREQRWLDAKIMKGQMSAKIIKASAKEYLANTPVGTIAKWQKYAANAARLSKESARLLSKGDYEGALQAKQSELLNHALAKEAGNIEKELQKNMLFFAKINKRGNNMKGIPHNFNVQIDNLLANFGLLNREPLKPLEGEPQTWKEFVADLQARYEDKNEDVYLVPYIPERFASGNAEHYTRLSLNDFQELVKTVQSLQHIGKQQDRLLTDKNTTFTQLKNEVMEQGMKTPAKYADRVEGGMKDKPLSMNEHVPQFAKTKVFALEKAVRSLAEMTGITNFLRTETILRWMDRGDEQGAFVRAFLNPLLDGQDNYNRWIKTDAEKLKSIMKALGFDSKRTKAMRNTPLYVPFMPNQYWTQEEIFCALLNYGNEGNRDRLRYYFMTGKQRGVGQKALSPQEIADIDARAIQMFETYLDKDHFKLAQAIWDMLDGYKERVRQDKIACEGVDPKMVDGSPFRLMKDGEMIEMRGGYYPIAYDRGRSWLVQSREDASEMFRKYNATNAMTRHGYDKERAAHNGDPLLLNFDVIANHIQEVNYGLAMRKAVIDVSRLLRDREIQGMISNNFGAQYYKAIHDWLKYVASPQHEELSVLEKAIRAGRTHMALTSLGFRPIVLFRDTPVNIMTAIHQMGANEFRRAVQELVSDPDSFRAQIAFISERSTMMREKTTFMDTNMADFRNSIFDDSQWKTRLSKAAFTFDMWSDMAVMIPVWKHTYTKALHDGRTEKQAIQMADSMVRRMSVDSTRIGSVKIQRSEYGKLLTPFYSYFSGLFQRIWLEHKYGQMQWADGRKLDAAWTYMAALGGLLILPAIWDGVATAALENDDEKDPEKQSKNFRNRAIASGLGTFTGLIPGAGQALQTGIDAALDQYSSFRFSPIEGYIERAFKTPYSVYRYLDGKEKDGIKVTRNVLDSAAFFKGYPKQFNTILTNILYDIDGQSEFTLLDFVTPKKVKAR